MTTQPPSYMPIHGTLAERVIEWLRKNPDEELQRTDVASKFNVAQSAVSAALAAAVAGGDLHWVKPSPSLPGVYRLGNGTPPIEVHAAASGRPVSAPPDDTEREIFGQRLSPESSDITVHVTPDRHITVCFLLPPHADPYLVAAAMLSAAGRCGANASVV